MQFRAKVPLKPVPRDRKGDANGSYPNRHRARVCGNGVGGWPRRGQSHDNCRETYSRQRAKKLTRRLFCYWRTEPDSTAGHAVPRAKLRARICFNTSLEGYLEVITDPSYAGQIVTMTYPQIGNYGVNLDDTQSTRPALRGLVVHDMCRTPSNWRSSMSLPEFLERENIVAIEGIDTRALVRHIRDFGAQTAIFIHRRS